MNKEITQGKVKQAEGKMKEAAGKLSGDESRELEGQAENIAGIIQEEYGKVKQSIHEATG